jgi:hypothetical protein
MRCVIALAGLVAAASAAPAAVVRQALGGPEIPGERQCTPTGQKCAGDEGRPTVPYADCCDKSKVCGYPVSSAGSWGRYCLDGPGVVANKTAVVTTTTVAPATTVSGVTTVLGASTSLATTVTGTDGKGIATTAARVSTVTDKFGKVITTTAATSTKKEGDSGCFPADATVELQDGSVIRMDAVAVGDSVKVGVNTYSRVFMFTHKVPDAKVTFVTLQTASGASLSLTNGHYLYANGALVAASEVSVGSELSLGDGDVSTVVAVGTTAGAGLFNPQTVNGNIVVDGIMASTYTTAVEPTFAHAVLAPFRLLDNFGFRFTALESGGGALDAVAPRGTQVV